MRQSSINLQKTALKQIRSNMPVSYTHLEQNEQTEQMKSLPDITDKWKQLAKEQAASLELVTEEREDVYKRQALDRYSKRHDGLPAESGIAELMDDWFPDPYMERVYPNIKFR